MGSFVFDHRPPLALRDVSDDANDPERLAAICSKCDGWKTPRDLRDIAQARRYGLIPRPSLRAGSKPERLPSQPKLNPIPPERMAIIELLRQRSRLPMSAGVAPRTAAEAPSAERRRYERDTLRQSGVERNTGGESWSADVVRKAEEYWAREAAGLGSWPPFSNSDLT
jgi:hypothetical protein